MNNSMAIMEVVKRDRNSPYPEVKMDYIGGVFIHSIAYIADRVASSKTPFVIDPTSFLCNGGTPCHPFPGLQLSKQSTNS